MKNKKDVIILLVYIIITFIFTYNLVKGETLTYPDALLHGGGFADNHLFIYFLSWSNHAMLTNPTQLFHATIFYPEKYSYLYGEHVFAQSLMSLPIYALTKNPTLGYNIVLLSTFILLAFGTYCLAKYYTGNRYAAFLAGIIFAFSTIRTYQIGHIQMLSIQWLPFVVLYFHKLFDNPGYKNTVILAIFFSLQVLSSWFLAVMLAFVTISLLFYMFLVKKIINSRVIKHLFLFAVISLTITGPFIYSTFMLGRTNELQFTLESKRYNSAILGAYFIPPYYTSHSPYFGQFLSRFIPIPNIPKGNCEWVTFLGYIPLLLLGFSILQFKKMNRNKKHVLLFYYVLGGIALLLSLGPYLRIGYSLLDIKLPVYFLKDFILFKPLRAFARFSFIVLFSMSIIIAIALSKTLHNIKKTPWKLIFISVLTVLILLEHFSPSLIVIRKYEVPEVYLWLKNQPEDVTILELPILYNNQLDHGTYMFYNTLHWKRMVNGVHNFSPPGYNEQMEILKEFPSKESIALIRELSITYVIFHKNIQFLYWEKLDEEKKEELLANKDIKIVKEFKDTYVFSVL